MNHSDSLSWWAALRASIAARSPLTASASVTEQAGVVRHDDHAARIAGGQQVPQAITVVDEQALR